MLTPEDRAHLAAEHTSNGGVCRRCGRDFPCPTVKALGEAERLRAAGNDLASALETAIMARQRVEHWSLGAAVNAERSLAAWRAALAGEGAS